MKQPIIVLGGNDTEREISLQSSKNVSVALSNLSIDHILIDPIDQNFHEILRHHTNTHVLNMLHGGWGENGGANTLLESYNLTSSSTTARSAKILMNKALTLNLAKKIGISVPAYQILTKHEYTQQILPYPHIIKFCKDSGSSIGVYKIKNIDEKLQYIQNWTDDQPRLQLTFINGLEYAAAFVNNKCLGGIDILYQADFCDYFTKYNPKSTLIHRPESYINRASHYIAKQMGLKLYKALKCKGIIRMDFMIDYITGIPYFLEANPNPGMTAVSIVPDIALFNHGWSYEKLVQYILDETK